MSSFYIVDVLEKLGYNRTNGSMNKLIRERVERENISMSHFKGKSGSRGGGNSQRYTLEEICVENSTYSNRSRLKIRLINEGVLKEICDKCGIPPVWNGRELVLQLDHINGVYNDNRIENLRFLYPNCHSQTNTYAGRNNKK